MENNTDNLKRLIERLKTFNLIDRLFRWSIIRTLLIDAASDLQGLLTNLDGVKSNLIKLESENSGLTKDLQLSRETAIRQENDINRINIICQEKDPKISLLSNELASERSRNGSLQEQVNLLNADVRVFKETNNNITTEND